MTCSPSRRRSASCSKWVTEWLARSRRRRRPSTLSSTASPCLQHAAGHIAEMNVQVARFFYRIAHRQLGAAGRKDDAGITNLAARLRIERRLVDDYRNVVAEQRPRRRGRRLA